MKVTMLTWKSTARKARSIVTMKATWMRCFPICRCITCFPICRCITNSRATFYKHYSERDEILAELFSRLLDAEVEIEAEGRDPESRVLSILRQVAAPMFE